VIFRSGDSITSEAVTPETSLLQRLALRPCHQPKTPNSPNIISRKAPSSLRDHRVDSVKAIIWLHNLTISHLETDYCHSNGTLFSLLYSNFQLNGIYCDSTPDLHPRRPTEIEQIFSFSVMITLVSMHAGFWVMCIFHQW